MLAADAAAVLAAAVSVVAAAVSVLAAAVSLLAAVVSVLAAEEDVPVDSAAELAVAAEAGSDVSSSPPGIAVGVTVPVAVLLPILDTSTPPPPVKDATLAAALEAADTPEGSAVPVGR